MSKIQLQAIRRAEAEEIGRSYRAWLAYLAHREMLDIHPEGSRRQHFRRIAGEDVTGGKDDRFERCRLQADGTLTTKRVARIYEDSKACAYCGGLLDDENKTLDHVVPLSRGGVNGTSNLVAACLPCNTSKRDRTVAEWIASGAPLAPRERPSRSRGFSSNERAGEVCNA